MNMQGPVLELEGVSQTFGAVKALDNVSLTIPAGCIAGLIGPDGVGKSTLLALVAGVRRVQRGKLFVLGGDIIDKAHRSECHTRIAYMPQGLGRNLYPTLSVFENLDFFGRLFGQGEQERNRRIEELLAATGLSPFSDRPAGKLSGGMKQKLGLCCALIHDPDLLILDEPTTGVDPLSRRQFWQLIERIRARRAGMSVLVATAYMDEADRFDWLAAMSDGKIISTGTPAEIKKRAGAQTLEQAFVSLLPQGETSPGEGLTDTPLRSFDGQTAIEARNLTRTFGDFTAVDDVSFNIERGEIFGFLGSNGCGKTTVMKMLTGLLPTSSGEALLFGQPLNARDLTTRRRVGYMSQGFSLYSELSVRQNLTLHAHLFELSAQQTKKRVGALLEEFDLDAVADASPDDLPLGIRQRLQLAVAILHEPDILILDEPTSGVDPVARDQFWRHLIDLSRNNGVTIFLSTHFMNEAERCDRISLMHAGRVLAVGTPQEIVASTGSQTLEDAFISHLEAATGAQPVPEQEAVLPATELDVTTRRSGRFFNPGRLWAYARRESMEILRDPIRLAFGLFGPLILMLTFGYGISFDVENLPYAIYDHDQSHESRQLAQSFAGSLYFEEHAPITGPDDLRRRLVDGELMVALEIPAGFGRKLLRNETPDINVTLDGAMPFRAETARAYVSGVAQTYLRDKALDAQGATTGVSLSDIEVRYRYNQTFESVFAIVPGVIMLMLILIPAMMTAVGVVREKETGSIANFRSTPVTRLEFLMGKQLPYLAIGYASFVSLVLLSFFVFGVPIKGSITALALGAFLYVAAATGFGLLVSSFTKTQIAAIFATAIVSIIPSVNFSGLLTPVSSLSGGARYLGLAFPSAWFQQITLGTITKSLGFGELWTNHLMLAGFALLFIFAARFTLSKQER